MIKSLKPTYSHGYDEIPVKILKVSSQFISSPLTKICNKSLSTGISPALLKYLVTKSLFKKGHKHAVSNYRPKSLLTFSKNFQKLIFARLKQHFNDNNILIEEQFRFRQNSSLEKAVFKLQNEILNASNNKFIFRGTF